MVDYVLIGLLGLGVYSVQTLFMSTFLSVKKKSGSSLLSIFTGRLFFLPRRAGFVRSSDDVNSNLFFFSSARATIEVEAVFV